MIDFGKLYIDDHAELINLPWSVAGHTIDIDVDFGGFDILNVENIGVGTVNPFVDFASSSGDFTGGEQGIHINASANPGALLIEGDGASLYLGDRAGDSNDKIFQWEVDAGVLTGRSLNDDLTTLIDNAIVVDLGTGKIGISTISPGASLHIDSKELVDEMIIENSVGVDTELKFRNNSGSSQESIIKQTTFASDDVGFKFSTRGNAEALVIRGNVSNGNVGINEIAPQDKLEVNGAILVKDKLILKQDDRNEWIGSENDGYLDYSATTAHRFRNSFDDNDVRMEFIGTTNSGLFTWMEDEDYFKFDDDLVLDKGVLFFKENTTPTAIADHGALYTKDVNELFFQDGAGVEHLLHGDAFSGMWFHSPSKATVTISTADTFTKITVFENIGREDDLNNVTSNISNSEITVGTNGGGIHDVTFHTSITSTGGSSEMVILVGIELNTPIDVTSATNATPIVVGKVAHGLLNGDMVTIVGGTGNTGVNGDWVVTSKTADAYTIVDLQGNDSVGNGTYDASSGGVTLFYPGNLPMHRVVSQTNLGVGGSNDDIALVAGDKLAMYVANIGATRNLEVAVINLKSERIGD